LNISFPKTHVLTDLAGLAITTDPTLTVLQPPMLVLEDYAVKFRYPGLTATTAQARAALQSLRLVRRRLRKRLGI